MSERDDIDVRQRRAEKEPYKPVIQKAKRIDGCLFELDRVQRYLFDLLED